MEAILEAKKPLSYATLELEGVKGSQQICHTKTPRVKAEQSPGCSGLLSIDHSQSKIWGSQGSRSWKLRVTQMLTLGLVNAMHRMSMDEHRWGWERVSCRQSQSYPLGFGEDMGP